MVFTGQQDAIRHVYFNNLLIAFSNFLDIYVQYCFELSDNIYKVTDNQFQESQRLVKQDPQPFSKWDKRSPWNLNEVYSLASVNNLSVCPSATSPSALSEPHVDLMLVSTVYTAEVLGRLGVAGSWCVFATFKSLMERDLVYTAWVCSSW